MIPDVLNAKPYHCYLQEVNSCCISTNCQLSFLPFTMVPPKKKSGITLRTILDHMQSGFGALREEIKNINHVLMKLTKRMDVLERNTKEGFAQVDRRLSRLEVGIENIDQRLDDIEMERLPKIEAKVL